MPEDSLSPAVNEMWIAAYVLFHEDVAPADASDLSASYDAVIASELHTVNGLVIELPLARIDDLAAEDSVKYIEPTLPPMIELNDSNRAITQADIV